MHNSNDAALTVQSTSLLNLIIQIGVGSAGGDGKPPAGSCLEPSSCCASSLGLGAHETWAASFTAKLGVGTGIDME